MAFVTGQRVTIIAPSSMAGCKGSIHGPLEDLDAYSVRLDGSDSLFVCMPQNLQADEELAFAHGQRVTVQGTVVGPIHGQAGFTVMLSDGHVRDFSTSRLQAVSSAPADEEESAFQPEQRATASSSAITEQPRG